MAKAEVKTYEKAFLLDIYRDMVRIRRFEEKAADCFTKGMLAGNIHLCIGQEGTVAGACKALEKGDYITSTHRGHGHCIGKGAKTNRAMAEIFGKATGYCGGKGGSMHIVDVSLGILGANGIVGAGISIATGSALASKVYGDKSVTLCFFGDGASNHGTFHESINMAAAWNLPVVYLCENNGYGVSVAINSIMKTKTIAVRAKAYDIPGVTVNGNDPLEVYEAVKKAVALAREGKGPSLIECMTYRHMGHYMGDTSWYRPKEYMEEAREKDAIDNFRKYLSGQGVSESKLNSIEQSMYDEIEAAYAFAQESPYPDVETVTQNMYTEENERCVAR